MFNFFRKPKISTPLFVASAIATFILLGLLFVYSQTGLNYDFLALKQSSNRYPFKNLGQNDPLMTRVPDINDALAGPIISKNDPQLGPEDAPVTIVEFSDFICRFCQTQEKIIKNLMALYPDKIRLIWKDYPETNETSVSFQAAQAARCAGQQNKFWPYHDLLFKTTEPKLDNFLQLTKQLNLEENQFKRCFAGQQTKTLIKDNIEEANALAIQGIPFIYINNQEVMGETTLADLKKMVEAELNKQ